MRDRLQFIIGDAQIPFGVGDALVIELVHDKRQVHSLHAGVISPGFPQAVGTVITSQSNTMANRNDEFPGLSSLDWFGVGIRLGVEEHGVLGVIGNTRVSCQIFFKRFSDTLVDHYFVSFVPFLFVNPEALFVTPLVIQKMTDP